MLSCLGQGTAGTFGMSVADTVRVGTMRRSIQVKSRGHETWNVFCFGDRVEKGGWRECWDIEIYSCKVCRRVEVGNEAGGNIHLL